MHMQTCLHIQHTHVHKKKREDLSLQMAEHRATGDRARIGSLSDCRATGDRMGIRSFSGLLLL